MVGTSLDHLDHAEGETKNVVLTFLGQTQDLRNHESMCEEAGWGDYNMHVSLHVYALTY